MKLLLLFAVTALGCGIALADDHLVKQEDRTFSVQEINIKPGDSVTFTNCDAVTHNVFSTSPANPFTIKIQKPGEATAVVFTNKGVTEVRCAIHPRMKIIVTVKN